MIEFSYILSREFMNMRFLINLPNGSTMHIMDVFSILETYCLTACIVNIESHNKL
jgi:hypothetical protein